LSSDDKLRETVLKYTVENAMKYGKANPNAVMKKVMKEHPELRPKAKEVLQVVRETVKEINSMDENKLKELAKELGVTERETEKEEEKSLKPLPKAEKGRVRLRFAPNPSGPLHLGHARAAVLNDEYAKMYDGTFILRLEDTDPKRVLPEAYDMIEEDLEWLGVDVHERYIQSNRLEIYYHVCEHLLEEGHAYVCTCDPDEFRRLKNEGSPCPCRARDPEDNLELWDEMLEGAFSEGEAVVRVKTDPAHPDPAVREWVAFRIVEEEHPLTGSRFIVWPTMNMAVAVDDHLMGVTHVLRGKDHESNTRRQKYIFEYMGWETPEYIHYGIMKVEGYVLSTSKIREGIEKGEYSGWDDVKLATLRALKRRGIDPEAVRDTILEIGLTEVDSTFSWEHLHARNRKIIDPKSNRYFFVRDPVELRIKGLTGYVVARLPLHPDKENVGERVLILHPSGGTHTALLDREDAEGLEEGDMIRLINAVNVVIEEIDGDVVTASYHSDGYKEAKEAGAKIVHWLPPDQALPCHVETPEGEEEGLVEVNIQRESPGSTVQFERLYFARLEEVQPTHVEAVYTHD